MKALLSVGSNFGNREQNVIAAIEWLINISESGSHSSIYGTQDLYGEGKPYLNAVVEVETQYSHSEFCNILKQYEVRAGRTEEARKRGDVPIDIDIVVYGEEIMRARDYNSLYFKVGLYKLKNGC